MCQAYVDVCARPMLCNLGAYRPVTEHEKAVSSNGGTDVNTNGGSHFCDVHFGTGLRLVL